MIVENARKHRDITLVTNDKRRNQLIWGPNYQTTKWFSEDLLALEMKKIKIKMINPVCLCWSMLEISKILMFEFWYGYINPKYQSNPKLCYIDTGSFIIHIKTEDFYKNIVDDVKKNIWKFKFQISTFQIRKLIDHYQKEKKIIGLMKDKLGGKILPKIVALKLKKYSYLTDGDKNVKKSWRNKKEV